MRLHREPPGCKIRAFVPTPIARRFSMSLAAGTRLGPDEIQSAISAGGTGEFYKSRDTRLDRTAAIKILPSAVSIDPKRRARFLVVEL